MRWAINSVVALAALATTTSALSILVNNDDGFGAANIRELYRLLKADGHEVVMVAPVIDNSGKGGSIVFAGYPNLTYASQWNIVPAGAPSLGQDPHDPDIWYYNGTPAVCTFVGLDYVIPKFYHNRTVDLVVTGPNFGDNVGPFAYTGSGTIGAAYAAVGKNIPAIAFSAGGLEIRPYTWINATTKSGYPDPATISAQLAVDVVNALANSTKAGEPLLPLGYGLNVNFPNIDSLGNATCVKPPFIQSRISGEGSYTVSVKLNTTTGLFSYGAVDTAAVNACFNGDCSLPPEAAVVSHCYSSVSVFTIDYTAPNHPQTDRVRNALDSLVLFKNPLA